MGDGVAVFVCRGLGLMSGVACAGGPTGGGWWLRVVAVVAACAAAVGSVGCRSSADVSGFAAATAELRSSASDAGDVVGRTIRRVEFGVWTDDGGGNAMASDRFAVLWNERLGVIDAMASYAERVDAASHTGAKARDGVLEIADAVTRLASAAGLGAGIGGGGGGAVGGVAIELGASVVEMIASIRASESVAAAVMLADPLVLASASLLSMDIESLGVIVRVAHEEARARVLTGEADDFSDEARERMIAEIDASQEMAVHVLNALASAVRRWAVSHSLVVAAIERGGELDLEALIDAVESVRRLVDRARGDH